MSVEDDYELSVQAFLVLFSSRFVSESHITCMGVASWFFVPQSHHFYKDEQWYEIDFIEVGINFYRVREHLVEHQSAKLECFDHAYTAYILGARPA